MRSLVNLEGRLCARACFHPFMDEGQVAEVVSNGDTQTLSDSVELPDASLDNELEPKPSLARPAFENLASRSPLPEPLSKCSYLDTFRASLVVASVLMAGSVLLGLSEQGVFGQREGQLASRFGSCILLFYYPIVEGLTEIRCLALGIQPKEGLCVLWKPTYSPTRWHEAAAQRGFPTRRAALLPVFFHVLLLVSLFCGVCLPLHPEGHSLGLVFVYLVTILGAMLVNGLVQRKVLPFLDHNYCMRSGMMLAISLAGFLIITIACCLLRPHFGGAFGLAMPILATCFEYVGTLAIGRCYNEHYVQHPEVVKKYAATQQSMYPSTCIAFLSASAHSARLTVLLSEALQDPDSDAWMLSLSATLILAVPVRLGYLQKFWHLVSRGRQRFSVYKLMMLKSQYQMGYPRFFAVAAIGLARAILGKPLVPSVRLAWVTFFVLVEEIAEDVLVAVCEYLGLMAKWDGEQEVKMSAVIPTSETQSNHSSETEIKHISETSRDVEGHSERKRIFAYRLDRVHPHLPFWAHFAACSISMYHTILFLFLMGGGTSFVLGICPQEAALGVGRGVLVWPTGIDACSGA